VELVWENLCNEVFFLTFTQLLGLRLRAGCKGQTEGASVQDKRQEAFLAEQKDFVRALDLLVWATRRTVLLRALIYSSNKRDAAFKAAALATRANSEFANWLLAKTRKRGSIRRLLWRLGFTGQAPLCANLMREWATGEKATSRKRRSNALFTRLASALKLRSTAFPEPVQHRMPMSPGRKNVLVVVHETSRTGAPILGWNIANRLSKKYNVFTVRCGDGPLTGEFEAISVAVCKQPRKNDTSRQLDLLFKQHSFEYAIINSTESRHLISLCNEYRVPTLFLVHEFASYVHPLRSLIHAFDEATHIIFPAPIVADAALNLWPDLEKQKLHILQQGRSVIPSQKTRKNLPPNILRTLEAEKKDNGALVVLGAGSVNIRKGVDLFIATAAAVRRAHPERAPYFIWVGDGYRPTEDMGYSVYLKEQVARSNLEGCVHIVDEVTDLDPFYALADVFFLSSRLDPLPNVAIDAAHCGIPIVCFRGASGISDLMLTEPQLASGVVDYLDIDGAAQAISHLLLDQVARSGIAAATSKFGQEKFDMDKYVENLDKIGMRAAEKHSNSEREQSSSSSGRELMNVS
jgi:glycosyltransferase involved in cell wall biosynthesis